MRLLSQLVICHCLSYLFTRASSQRVEGRYLRPNQSKCDKQTGCALREDYPELKEDKDHAYDADKRYPEDDYRSIGGGERPHVNRGDTIDLKPGRDDYVYKPVREEPVNRPGSGTGYNRKPVIDRLDYIPKPVDHVGVYDSKDDALIPPGPGGGHITKPVRGGNTGYKPRPIDDLSPYVPKPFDGSYDSRPDRHDYVPRPPGENYRPKPPGYNTKPDRDDYEPKPPGENYRPKPPGYNTKPDRDDDEPKPPGENYRPKPPGYNTKPDRDDYVPKPSLVGDDDVYKHDSGGSYRPKPEVGKDSQRPRPIPDDYHKPGRPIGPPYPNKDLGGYNDPKDDDYIGVEEGLKDEDYIAEVKPIPVVEGNCICVPYYQCQEGHIVTDGAGIIDARKKPEPDEELPLDGKFKPPTCGPFHVCCNTPETSTVKPYNHRCGVRNPSGINSRILSPSNKGEADFGEWPWQAAVLKSEGKVNIFQCGGVLIDKFHVLTVAHCVFHLYKYNEYPLKVRLGEWDTQTTTEFLAHEDYRVSKIIVHPEYRNTSLWNDIAILRLEEAVLFAPHIDTICLPKYDEIFSEQNCVVTGWGKDAYKGGTFSNIMKEVALQVIDNYKCEEMLRKTRLGRFFNLYEGFLCAGGEYGLDSCKGDGGGPLVCYRKDKSYALAGIVSWGIDCGQPGVPGVYVKIQKYLDWISKNTGVDLEEYWPKH